MPDETPNLIPQKPNANQSEDSINSSLESPASDFSSTETASNDSQNLFSQNDQTAEPVSVKKQNIFLRLKNNISHGNVYLLLFVFVLVLAAIAAFASFNADKNAKNNASINGQSLSAEDLQNLKNNNTTVGDSKQTLTIASNAIFNGKVLIRDNLDVAGTIKVGSALTLPGITVAGTSTFENVQISKNLAVAGNSVLNGSLGVQGNLTIGGSATFTGSISASQLNINSLALNNDILLNRHIDAGGPTPGASAGGAVGSGGTVSVSGTDTAGTVNINFGGGPPAGVIANINFGNSFRQIAHVVITPVGANCAALNYYISSSTSGFVIATTNGGPPGSSCAFNYIAID